MKALVALLVAAGAAFVIYALFLKKMPTTDEGTATTQAINLTGVRMDLLQIGQAERGYVALNGKCGSLEDLNSSGSMSMSKSGREGYTYSVECSGNEFTVKADHAPAPPGSPIRYPILVLDQTLQVREAN